MLNLENQCVALGVIFHITTNIIITRLKNKPLWLNFAMISTIAKGEIMSFSDTIYYLSGFSPIKIVLSILALIASLILKNPLKRIKLRKLTALIPFVCAIILNLLYAVIFNPKLTFGDVLKEGISTGSAATAIYAVITGFLKEQTDYQIVPLDSLIIEGLLAGYIPDDKLTEVASNCAEVLQQDIHGDKQMDAIKNILAKNTVSATDAEIEMLAKIMRNILIATS